MPAASQTIDSLREAEPGRLGADRVPRVLVVDDCPEDRTLAVSALRERGYLVAEARDCTEGMALVETERPDLVVLSASLGSAGGFADCEALRGDRETRRLPVLMTAASDDLESIELASRAGATDFLSKPFNAAVLGFRVRRMLEAHAGERELREAKSQADDAFDAITMLSRTLEQQVEQRTAQLAAAQSRLLEKERQLRQAQKMDALGQLAGGVAHEFNNQLTVMSGFGRAALDSIDNPERVRNCLNEVVAAADRASALTAQMLLFSRDQVIEPTVMHIGGAIDGMKAVLRSAVGGNIDVVLDTGECEAAAKADPVQLSQALLNLTVNARDAMPQGGRLTIFCDTVVLDGGIRISHGTGEVEPGRYVRLVVKDTGTGMDPATLERIFDPFFTTKEIGKGTGLGLSVVFGIVEQCGGIVDVQSALGVGTTISIYFPVSYEPVAPAAACRPTGIDYAGGETILVVEDEGPLLNLLSMTLREVGYHVLPASDGLEVLEVIREAAPDIDLFIADVVMPGLSGVDLAAAFETECPGKPVLFMSGYAPEQHEHVAQLTKGSRFIGKPFTPWQLVEKVKEILGVQSARATS